MPCPSATHLRSDDGTLPDCNRPGFVLEVVAPSRARKARYFFGSTTTVIGRAGSDTSTFAFAAFGSFA